MSSWLKALPKGKGRFATFETKVRGPWGNATSGISKGLEAAGYTSLAKGKGFLVAGKFGPLREGEIEKARAWGEELAKLMG